ncbi:MAG: ferrous iron transport protein A, partial [Actinomycetales bacterium]|nr:ferrous iron transport protein A [Actinomycetales bacterium]
ADPRLLSFCTGHGITVGTILEVHAGTEFSESLEVAVVTAGTRVALGRSATDAIWVAVTAQASPQ